MFNLSFWRRRLAVLICPEIITERRALLRDIETDDLTGLANGRAFKKAAFTADADEELVFILFDANNFGQVNKQLGHETGDRVLQTIAANIKQACAMHSGARAFHLHGDEFAVIAPAAVACEIRDRAEMLFGWELVAPGVFVSVSGTIGATIAAADQVLQSRKKEQKQV